MNTPTCHSSAFPCIPRPRFHYLSLRFPFNESTCFVSRNCSEQYSIDSRGKEQFFSLSNEGPFILLRKENFALKFFAALSELFHNTVAMFDHI